MELRGFVEFACYKYIAPNGAKNFPRHEWHELSLMAFPQNTQKTQKQAPAVRHICSYRIQPTQKAPAVRHIVAKENL